MTISGSIGKRYARTDEIAIPYGVTIDFHSIKIEPFSVSLRDRDTLDQVRVEVDEIAQLVEDLANGSTEWKSVQQKYPNQEEWMSQHPID